MADLPELNTQGISIIPGIVAGQELRNLQSRNQLYEIEAKQQMQQQQREDTLRKIMAHWKEGQDNSMVIDAAMRIDPEVGQKLALHQSNVAKVTQEERVKAGALAKQMLGYIAAEPDDNKAAQMYDIARQDFSQLHPNMATLVPPQFNRQFVNHMYQSMISPQERFKAEQNQWGAPIAGQDEQGNQVFISPNRNAPMAVPTQMGGGPGMGGGYAGGVRPRPQQPLVNIGNQQESEEAKAYGKHLVEKEYSPLVERANVASELLGNLRIAKNIDIQTGALEPMKNRIGAYVQALGINPVDIGLPNAGNAQALTGILQNVVLHKMQAQKGPQTENDAKRIEMTVSNLGQTPEAFKFLLNAATALEERAVFQRDFYDLYRDKKGTFQGAAQAWEQFKRETPLMVKNPKTGRPVFYQEFKDANPGVPEGDLLQAWRRAGKE